MINLKKEISDLVEANTKDGVVEPKVAMAITEMFVRETLKRAQLEIRNQHSLQIAGHLLSGSLEKVLEDVRGLEPNDSAIPLIEERVDLAKTIADTLLEVYGAKNG